MNDLLEKLILEFKKMKRVRGNIFENFITFVHLVLTTKKDDKYKVGKVEILKYIAANEEDIKLKLVKN
tara:strand:+ start:1244 stop:1447 length:204 start_codon:yes stop_codon:yes gene_type:complete